VHIQKVVNSVRTLLEAVFTRFLFVLAHFTVVTRVYIPYTHFHQIWQFFSRDPVGPFPDPSDL